LEMDRWIARFLLVLSLVGVLTPAGLALAAPPAHACCARKTMHCHTPHEAQFQTPGCCGHECCRSLTASQFAEQSPVIASLVSQDAAALNVALPTVALGGEIDSSHSGRAPPVSFLN
jgi:hypothetical protein